jgi:hypothetical protein
MKPARASREGRGSSLSLITNFHGLVLFLILIARFVTLDAWFVRASPMHHAMTMVSSVASGMRR